MGNEQPILRIENLTKVFPGTVAVDHVNMEIRRNEVMALIGENGAGKSTLCKMLTGIYHSDEGNIYVNGERVEFKSAADSMAAGINMVYQERNLIGFLNVAQNISLGKETVKSLFIDEKAIRKKAREISDKLSISIPLDEKVENLGAGSQQLVEIMRAFFEEPAVLILDEPTASLGEGEIEPFLEFIKTLKKTSDISIIYITHKLEEVFEIADRVTVMTDGRVAMQSCVGELCMDDCVRAMIRADKIRPLDIPEKDCGGADTVLEVGDLEVDGKIRHLNICLREGEVTGMYGLVGSGRTEAMETIFGLRYSAKKNFTFAGEKISGGTAVDMLRRGMVLTPELRVNGIFKTLSLIDNINALFVPRFAGKNGLYKGKASKAFARQVLSKNGVKFSSPDQLIMELSGGNMQKIIIGRSIEVDKLKLLILDEPTAGMDLGAKNDIYRKIRSLSDVENKSVIFISSELDELISVCDKLYVFHRGDVVKELGRKDFSKETILSYAIKGDVIYA